MKDLDIIQKNELIILKEIKRICEKHNIKYYLGSGTLLGSIRHNGFIPWDDDIDIEMPLPDYKKFLKICKTELGEGFFLQNYKTDLNDHLSFTKVRMNNTTFIPIIHTKYHIHHGFWVDVFPVVSIPKNEKLLRIKRKILQISNYCQIGDFIKANYDEFYNTLGPKRFKAVMAFNKLPMSIRKLIHSTLLFIVYRKPRPNCRLAHIWTAICEIPSKTLDQMIEHKFEDDVFNIPKNYDEYLVMMFGDYMKLPPKDQRIGHGNMIVDENLDYSNYVE